MSIDIRQLHIGSHIAINGERAKVISIDEHGLIGYRTPDDLGRVGASDVEPIPITPELLKELGFEFRDKGCWQYWSKSNFYLAKRNESSYWMYEGEIGVQYLHELENLYSMIYDDKLIKD